MLIQALAIAALLGEDYPQATALLEESLSLARELENLVLEAAVLVALGLVALFEGAFEDGGDLIRESLALSSRLGDKRTSVECLHALAGVSAAAGEAQRAATLSGAAEKLLELIHAPPSPTEPPICSGRSTAVTLRPKPMLPAGSTFSPPK